MTFPEYLLMVTGWVFWFAVLLVIVGVLVHWITQRILVTRDVFKLMRELHQLRKSRAPEERDEN